MKPKNTQSLESLSLYCHIGGLVSIGIAIFVIFMDIMAGHFGHIQTGIFICSIGYTLAKISSKITAILQDEKEHKIGFYRFNCQRASA